MEKFKMNFEPQYERISERSDEQQEILEGFTSEEQIEIKKKQSLLSGLAYFIGKDFSIPVELNSPGAGWHWDFEKNTIKIDPEDVLEKPMDYLRFVVCHEGGHRRITRADFISLEEWQQPGFSFLMNAIEDPRINNFVAESYPTFREQMESAYSEELSFGEEVKEEASQKMGYRPRYMQAGLEYIRQWFREVKGQEIELSSDLPEEVRDVVSKTIEAAQDSWWRYPSRAEADQGDELIKKYAIFSYEINRDKIWPEFKKLIEDDMKDQNMQEFFKDAQEKGGDISQDLKDKLSPEEEKELEEALKQAIENTDKNSEGAGVPINLDSLGKELKERIREYIDSLPEDKKSELEERAKKSFKVFEDSLNKELEGKLSENPEKRIESEEGGEGDEEVPLEKKESSLSEYEKEEIRKYKEELAKKLENETVYEEVRSEVLPFINKLETELREIFTARKDTRWKSGFKIGKRIDMKKRMQEKAKSIPAVESRAWQKRELPQEKDYAISVLVDLSGSMAWDKKIKETFKAVVVLTEVLNRLSINLEVLGFNNKIFEYQSFGQEISKSIRTKMEGMLEEVYGGGANWNDDGWALEQTSERLEKQKVDQKFLIVLSDGLPAESSKHPRSQYELSNVVKKIAKETDVKLIGLGVGLGTEHVSNYYPNSIAGVKVDKLVEKLSGLIREVIENYDKF